MTPSELFDQAHKDWRIDRLTPDAWKITITFKHPALGSDHTYGGTLVVKADLSEEQKILQVFRMGFEAASNIVLIAGSGDVREAITPKV